MTFEPCFAAYPSFRMREEEEEGKLKARLIVQAVRVLTSADQAPPKHNLPAPLAAKVGYPPHAVYFPSTSPHPSPPSAAVLTLYIILYTFVYFLWVCSTAISQQETSKSSLTDVNEFP